MVRPIIERAGYSIVAIFDNDPLVVSPFQGIPLVGGRDEFLSYRACLKLDTKFVVAVGGNHGRARCELSEMLISEELSPLTLVHPTAHVAETAQLGEGTQVLPMSALCEEARVGRCCIINTNASVDHESILGDGVHIMPGATVAGAVEIGNFATIGSNATVLPRVRIGEGALIGAGAVVTKDVASSSVVAGVPARVVRPRTSQPI